MAKKKHADQSTMSLPIQDLPPQDVKSGTKKMFLVASGGAKQKVTVNTLTGKVSGGGNRFTATLLKREEGGYNIEGSTCWLEDTKAVKKPSKRRVYPSVRSFDEARAYLERTFTTAKQIAMISGCIAELLTKIERTRYRGCNHDRIMFRGPGGLFSLDTIPTYWEEHIVKFVNRRGWDARDDKLVKTPNCEYTAEECVNKLRYVLSDWKACGLTIDHEGIVHGWKPNCQTQAKALLSLRDQMASLERI